MQFQTSAGVLGKSCIRASPIHASQPSNTTLLRVHLTQMCSMKVHFCRRGRKAVHNTVHTYCEAFLFVRESVTLPGTSFNSYNACMQVL